MKHKHERLIKLWADGAEIEFLKFNGTWAFIAHPSWDFEHQYRLKRPEWQQKLIDAAREGKEVQIYLGEHWLRSFLNDELDAYQFLYYAETDYRIKPQPDLVKYVSVKIASGEICRWNIAAPAYANLILTFDGETGEPKLAEVI
jgi:hypothetical protein